MQHVLKHPAVLHDTYKTHAVPDWNEIPPAPRPATIDSSVLLSVGRVLWLPLTILIFTLFVLSKHP